MASVGASVLNPVCKNVIVGASLRCRAAREALSIGRWLARGLYKLFFTPPAYVRAHARSRVGKDSALYALGPDVLRMVLKWM